MSWIDVYFPSKYHKGRYFSAALITCEMKGIDDDAEAARAEADKRYAEASLDIKWHRIPRKSPKDQKLSRAEFIEIGDYAKKREFTEQYEKELNATARMITPEIRIDLDYWYPAIGLHAVVNTPSLTEESIIQFIKMFQDLGEPISAGLVWTGEPVETTPAKLNERHAEYRSNSIKADIA